MEDPSVCWLDPAACLPKTGADRSGLRSAVLIQAAGAKDVWHERRLASHVDKLRAYIQTSLEAGEPFRTTVAKMLEGKRLKSLALVLFGTSVFGEQVRRMAPAVLCL